MRAQLTTFARGMRRRLTDGEARLWARLRNRQLEDLKFRRQVPRGRYVADFLCDEAMLILEIDGNYDVLQNTDRVLDHICAVAQERRMAPSSVSGGDDP